MEMMVLSEGMNWREIWNDPVWSKVIAGVVLAGGSSAWVALRHQAFPVVLLPAVLGLAFLAWGLRRRFVPLAADDDIRRLTAGDDVRTYSDTIKLDRGCRKYEVFYPVLFVRTPNLTIKAPDLRDYELLERPDGFVVNVRSMIARPLFDREGYRLSWIAKGVPVKLG